MSSPFRRFFFFWPILLFVPGPSPLPAQGSPASNEPNLPHLMQKSGYIFAGTVTAVERIGPAQSHAVATTRITFRVDQSICGPRAGQTLAIHEWAGLWDSGERYRTGEQVLLFLYPLSKLGLTSPVGGVLGRFKLDRNGQEILNQARMQALMPGPESRALLRNKTGTSGGNSNHQIQRPAEE
jgi:hypothetical protein